MPAKNPSASIAILDYGMGNLSSVEKAIRHLGGRCVVTRSAAVVRRAQKIILPGVGSFGDAMSELRKRRLIRPLQEHFNKRKKFLGICLGLQLLFEKSEESPRVRGLEIFKGKVTRFKTRKAKIPQMGWNRLTSIRAHPLLRGITKKDYFYFVHSYYAASSQEQTWAQGEHGKEIFTAIVGNSHALAVQFHPEKSQAPGLRILKNFIRW